MLEGLARHLHNLGLVVYSTTGAATISLGVLPPTPNSMVSLRDYASPVQDAWLGYDVVLVQVLVRGEDRNPLPVRTRAYAIYNALHGMGKTSLPNGTVLTNCVAQQAPQGIGLDENGRYLYDFTLAVEARNQTLHRE